MNHQVKQQETESSPLPSQQGVREVREQDLAQINGGLADPLIRQPDGSYKPLFPYLKPVYVNIDGHRVNINQSL